MVRVRVRLGLFRVRLGLFSVRVRVRLGLFRVRVRVSINPSHNPKTDSLKKRYGRSPDPVFY